MKDLTFVIWSLIIIVVVITGMVLLDNHCNAEYNDSKEIIEHGNNILQ